MHRRLRCMPAHSQLRLRLSTKFIAFTPRSPSHLNVGVVYQHAKKAKNPARRGEEEEELSHLYVCVWYLLSWLCVKRGAETSVSPALLDKPPLPLYSRSLSLLPPSPLSLSLSALSHPPRSPPLVFFPRHLLFFLHLPLSPSFVVSSLNLLLPLKLH